MLTIGHIEGRNSTWALRKSAEMGYHFETGGATDVVQLFKDVLDKDNVSSATTVYINIPLCVILYGLLRLLILN